MGLAYCAYADILHGGSLWLLYRFSMSNVDEADGYRGRGGKEREREREREISAYDTCTRQPE